MEALGENLETMPRVPLADHHVAALHRLGRIRTYAEGEVPAELAAIGVTKPGSRAA